MRSPGNLCLAGKAGDVRAGDAKIRQLDPTALIQQYVFRFEITVNDPIIMRTCQTGTDLSCDPYRFKQIMTVLFSE